MKSQRGELDVEQPDDQVIWEGIRQDLQGSRKAGGKRRMLIRMRNVAAAVLILVSVGYVILDITGDQQRRGEVSLADIDRSLADREREYRSLIGLKQKEAGFSQDPDHEIIAELLEEIQRLDTIYEESMKDLKELGYNEQVIQTIFDTYEKKIYLLELIILENNKIKNHETETKLLL